MACQLKACIHNLYPPCSVFVLSKYIWDKISCITKSVMKFFVFLEKWIYFQNKNILFRYKNLLNDLFHNIFWLQKVYQKCITKVKKEPDPPYFRGIRAKIVLLKLAKFYLIYSTYSMIQLQISSILNCFICIISDAIESYCHFIVTNSN